MLPLTEYTSRLAQSVEKASYTTKDGKRLFEEEAVPLVLKYIRDVQSAKKKILFVGNGGSASIASHFSQDFSKVAGIRALSFNDGALLTCLSNDFSFAECFQKAVEMYADSGDLLFAISSSGKSMNIRNAAEAASRAGCRVITLSGFEDGNPLSALGDLNIYVPSSSYGIVESAHSVLIHALLDSIVSS